MSERALLPIEQLPFKPIDDHARDGESKLVRRGSQYATAYWTGDMWAYVLPTKLVHQIDFEPTEYHPIEKVEA